MKTQLAASALALATTVALGPLVAETQAEPLVARYSTRFFDTQKGGGEYTGTLQLRISSSGIVNGNYFLFDQHPSGVTGGRSGSAIWLRIPALGGRTLNGAVAPDGRIVAFTERRGDRWEFEAKPTR